MSNFRLSWLECVIVSVTQLRRELVMSHLPTSKNLLICICWICQDVLFSARKLLLLDAQIIQSLILCENFWVLVYVYSIEYAGHGAGSCMLQLSRGIYHKSGL